MSPISGLVGEPIRVPWNIHKEVHGTKRRGEPWYSVRCQGTKTMTPLLPLELPSNIQTIIQTILPSNIQTIIPSNIQSNTFKAKKEQGFLFWFCIFVFFIFVLYFFYPSFSIILSIISISIFISCPKIIWNSTITVIVWMTT